jgi:hypothetical protein
MQRLIAKCRRSFNLTDKSHWSTTMRLLLYVVLLGAAVSLFSNPEALIAYWNKPSAAIASAWT